VSRPVTLADVARRAGVHPATVSRVLSRPELVAPATRALVEEAVRELDFVPNRLASGLARGRSGAIGILVPDVANPYFAAIVQAAQNEAARHDLVVVLADTRHDAAEEERAVTALRAHVDGLVICSPVRPRHHTGSLPLVYLNRRTPGVSSVTVDQGRIVELAIDHLGSLGHRSVVVLNGPDSYWSSARRAEALAAFRPARRRPRCTVVGDQEPTFAGGWKAAAVALDARATAVVAFNDLMALGVMAAASAAGVAVPTTLSVVGSDDVDAASMSWPPLTTVASPLPDLGRVAVSTLVAEGAGRSRRSHIVLDPVLVVRSSTGEPGPR
jgi:LacI family transcriptional regulator